MTKTIGIPCILFVVIAISLDFRTANITASEPLGKGNFCVQVPHVVLPETIQYKTYTDPQGIGGNVNVTQRPATYTAFPSYSLPEGTEFRTINQLYYPVLPMVQPDLASGTVAPVDADKPIASSDIHGANQQQTLEVPKFAMPSLDALAPAEPEPIFLTRLDETKNPIRQVSDNTLIEQSSEDFKTPAHSIVFLKSRRIGEEACDRDFDRFDDDFVPTRLSPVAHSRLDWLERESLFVKPVTFTEVAPPTQLGFVQPNTGFQPAQPLPAYGQLCRPNDNSNYGQQQFPPNPYSGMFAAGVQPMPAPSQQYQSLAQLGGIMPLMSGQHTVQQHMIQMPGYGMAMPSPMQQPMQPAVQQQTIGYILLYPQAAQSGVNMQLAGQQGPGNDGTSSAGNEEATDSVTPNWNAMQFQATFIPAAQMPNFVGQTAMPQMPMANPMMPGGMNPYMMNPMMSGGMNPYMMNPSMMNPYMMNPYMMNPMMMSGGMHPSMINPMTMMMPGMSGMMPPIIIQMPADSGRRRGGLFARLRAAREESQNRTQQASYSLASLFTQPGQMPQAQMPAKAAYPYGYFGVTAPPQQSGNFGGYHDLSAQTVRYPGM